MSVKENHHEDGPKQVECQESDADPRANILIDRGKAAANCEEEDAGVGHFEV